MLKILRQTVCFQALGYIFQFSAFFIFAKILGTQGQGILSVFRALGQIFASLIWVGLPAGMVFFVARDNACVFSSLKNCFKWFCVVFFLLVLFLCFAPIHRLPKLNQVGSYIYYLLVFIFLLSLFSFFRAFTLSLKKYLHYNLFAFGLGVLIFGFSIITSFAGDNHNKLTVAVISYIIGYALMSAYGFCVCFYSSWKLKDKIRVEVLFSHQLAVGFKGFASNIAGLLMFRLDLFLVGYFLSFKEAGIYSIALFSAEMITKLPYWSASILTPMVASNEDGHVRRTVYLFYSSMIIAFLLGMALVSIFFVVPDFISQLIGKDFKGIEVCLLLLLPRVIMQSSAGVMGANLAGKGYPWQHFAAAASGLISVVLLDILLVPRYGIAGAAVASSIGFVSTFVFVCIGFYVHNITNEESLRSHSVGYIKYVRHLFSTKIFRVLTKQT